MKSLSRATPRSSVSPAAPPLAAARCLATGWVLRRSRGVLMPWVFAWSAGNWKADKALTLATSPATYPVWEGTALVYTGFALEYKYIVTKKEDVQWENGPVNRR